VYPTSEELVMRISLVARFAPLWISSAACAYPGWGTATGVWGARSSTFSDVGHYCEEVAVGAASPELGQRRFCCVKRGPAGARQRAAAAGPPAGELAGGKLVGARVELVGLWSPSLVVGSPEGISPPGSHRTVRDSLPSYGSCRSGPRPRRGYPGPVSEVRRASRVTIGQPPQGLFHPGPILLLNPPQQVGVDAVEQRV
jgi:hypothetical protein